MINNNMVSLIFFVIMFLRAVLVRHRPDGGAVFVDRLLIRDFKLVVDYVRDHVVLPSWNGGTLPRLNLTRFIVVLIGRPTRSLLPRTTRQGKGVAGSAGYRIISNIAFKIGLSGLLNC